MKLFNLSIMVTVRLNYLFLISILFASVSSAPSAPLDARNEEIKWEAWLLVDDQNQNRHPPEGTIPRRRITPKSVFVAQPFSPDKLPPCADGYSSDAMGRCVKIIKIDEDKHLEFLMNKLNNKFGSSLDYETILEEDDVNSEPTRVDIPLITYDEYSNDTPQEEVDMAIIVTPTTRAGDEKGADDASKLGKREDNKKMENQLEEELKELLVTTTEQGTTDPSTDSTTMETETEPISTTMLATDTTTLKPNFDFTTATVPTTTTTAFEDTTVITTTTTTPKITTYHPIATTYHPFFDMSSLSHTRTKNLVRFPEDEATSKSSSRVRFPDLDSKYQQEGMVHHTRNVDDQTGNYYNEIITPQPSHRVQEMILPPQGNPGQFYPRFFPDKSRKFLVSHQEKKLFQLPPKWSEEPHKPIVLRFSRKHFNVDVNKFKNSEFYRSMPTDDLRFLFGYKNGQNNSR